MTSSPAPRPDAPADAGADDLQEATAPACVMSFNAADPSGAGGLAGDIATVAAMGAHALPVVTAIVMRDTADIFDQHEIEADAVDGLSLGQIQAARSCGTSCGIAPLAPLTGAVMGAAKAAPAA